MVVSKNGDIVMRDDVKSDPSGNFTAAFMLPPNTSPNNYTVRIISGCRSEHMDICTNQDTVIPIILTGNSIKTKVEPSNISSMASYPKKYPNTHKSGIMCNGQPATILGTPGNDMFTQIHSGDIINSLEGNDTIYISGMGNERVCTSEGDDVVIDNSLGNDIIYGGIGNDEIISFSNYTMINGEEGNELIIVMGNGESTIYGGNNNDVVIDNSLGNDIIYGGIGKDVISSNSGSNTIHGGYSNDSIFDDTENSFINGDEGYDVLIGGEKFKGIIDGGPGVDECKSSGIMHNCEL